MKLGAGPAYELASAGAISVPVAFRAQPANASRKAHLAVLEALHGAVNLMAFVAHGKVLSRVGIRSPAPFARFG